MLDDACIYVAGHLHNWGELTTEQRHGRITHAMRVRGYKRSDVYAKRLGFYEQNYGCSCLIVVNPTLSGPGRVHVAWDLEAGAQYLRALQGEPPV
tara:strand:+ start:275 stop:559 length:285 start_codon:yes stop_codon:yes gene_type:complete